MNEAENGLKAHDAVERVCELLGDVSAEQIWGRERTYKIATARQLVMWYLYRVCGMSYPEVGRAMGKNHATVIWGVRQTDNILELGRNYDRRIINAANELRNETQDDDEEAQTDKC